MIVNCDIHVPDKILRKHIRYMKKNNLQSTTFDYKNQPVYIYIENKNVKKDGASHNITPRKRSTTIYSCRNCLGRWI